MRFKYSTLNPNHSEAESLPRVPLKLSLTGQEVEAIGLVDSGATVNVLPYDFGLQLGAVWDNSKARIRLAGNLDGYPAIPLFVMAQLGSYAPVRLAFAWTQSNKVPVILGQTNFFMEFEVCFHRFKLEFEVKPKYT